MARTLRREESLLCNFSAETSDFVRFNQGRVRQAGSVEQRSLTVRLVHGRRQAAATLTLGGTDQDFALASGALGTLRDALPALPEDPWLLVNESPQSTSRERRGALAPPEAVVDEAIRAARGLDLVGIYAGGTLYRGFANSLGQRNWHEIDSFNFDFSLHGAHARAAKSGYAGFYWAPEALAEKVDTAAEQLKWLQRPAREIAPGECRAYLGPRALEELMGLLSWGGFSARARATRQSPLLRMQAGERLSGRVSLLENTQDGIAPGFQADGFVKPSSVTLVKAGALAEALVSPRSAREYGLASNAANGRESPESLDLAPGRLEDDQVLAALDTGLYIDNFWYLNFSDRPAGRITGMTRFATFWVEGGRIVAPVAPMRFDDTIYRMLGERLVDLTVGRQLLLDSLTYGERSVSSARLPGALLGGLRLTL